MSNRSKGDRGESLAVEYLRRSGFVILATNVHTRFSEVDVIAREGDALCFVEVKLRSSDRFGMPEDAVDRRKQQRLRRAARHVLQTASLPRYAHVRFDVVAIVAGEPPEIRLLRDAF